MAHYYLEDDQKQRLISMYNEVKESHQKLFPKCGFFPTEFLFYKLAMLIGVTNVNIPSLKSELTLRIMEDRWRELCNHLEWTYIPLEVYP